VFLDLIGFTYGVHRVHFSVHPAQYICTRHNLKHSYRVHHNRSRLLVVPDLRRKTDCTVLLEYTPCKICKIGPRPQEYCDEAIAMGLRVRLQETDDIETPLVGHRRTFSKHDSNMLAGPLTTGSLTSGPSIPVKSSVSDTAQDRKRSKPIAPTPQRVNKKGGQSTCL
jgi:hypothetical protein